MRKNESAKTCMVVRERERESKEVKNSCSLFDTEKEQLIKYIYRGTGYRKKRERASFTEQFDSNSKQSGIAEKELCRSVDVKDRKWKTFTKKSSFFLCANLQKNKLAAERGITLLTLIITVVIMIILAAVTINVTLGDGGLIGQAKTAAEKTQEAAKTEQEQLDEFQKELANILAENEGPVPIPDTETQVANYADVDGNGTVDGIIYADLAVGGSGTWNPSGNSSYNSYGQYTIPKGSDFKKYKVTQESYTGSFGTGKVIAPIDGSSGNERFYVMALTDVDGKQNEIYYCWYDAAYGKMNDYASQTSTDFGAGEQNTINMINKWNNSSYGAQNDGDYDDMWGISPVNSRTWNGSSGWYIPSRGEWTAFGDQLGITMANDSSKGLSSVYWSSSQYDTGHAWNANFVARLHEPQSRQQPQLCAPRHDLLIL